MVGCAAAIISVALTAGEPTTLVGVDRPSERWWAGVDIGWVDDFDNSRLWSSGYAAGVSVSWAVDAAWSFGGRFGIDHWTYEAGRVVQGLVPHGATLTVEESTGSVQLLQFAPFARYGREGVIGPGIGAFVQGALELSFIKPYALTELRYRMNTPDETYARFFINESRWRPGAAVSIGFTHSVSDQSWVELFPTYRAIFDSGGTRELWTLSLGFRMRV